MPNPFEFISEIRSMNQSLCERLDEIIELLKQIQNNTDLYGDGR